MKANLPRRRPIAAPTRAGRGLDVPALFATLLLAGCASVPPPPAAAPPAVAVMPAPVLPRAPQTVDWRDAPLASGDWHYANAVANFDGSVVLACTGMPGARHIELSILHQFAAAPIAADEPVTITTTDMKRLMGSAGRDATLVIAPNDPLLDAIAFSRGRFMIEVGGQPWLILPVRPAIARVIEDCRRPTH